MLVIDASQVRAAFPMTRAVALMRETMASYGRGEAHQPPRSVIEPPGLGGSVMLKPGAVNGAHGGFGLKVLTIFPDNRRSGLETIQAFVALLDADSGVLRAVVEGGAVTEIRTAAVSAVATDVLARPDAGDVAILGAGVQARGHLLAMAEVRSLRRVRLWNRTPARAAEFVQWAAEAGFDVEVCTDVRAAVENADLLCTVTAASEPLFEDDWIAPGTHINAVGAYRAEARELPSALVARAAVFAVDSRQGALADAGDLVLAMREGAVTESFRPPELGELLIGAAPGRVDDEAITVFESLGLAIQDVAASAAIWEHATENGVGTAVPFP